MKTDQYIFLVIFRSVLLKIRNVSDETCKGYKNTHFVFSNFFFKNCAVYEIKWTKYYRVEQTTDENMANAHCILDN
jgi:hypothetical protein